MLTVTVRCEATAHPHTGARPLLLATDIARSPRLALRWLRNRAQHIANQLDPPHAQPLRHWLVDEAAHEHALHLLATGHPYHLTAYDDEAHYHLHAEPLR
ncbi:hypothetical protein WDH52_10340 [Streptomyces sp. TRM70308]|uniref:hypothetical protein n=1 Tax=Streptomyces sp. TRM70308 TaxID=3131932 RepID=UPI003CFFEBCA